MYVGELMSYERHSDYLLSRTEVQKSFSVTLINNKIHKATERIKNINH